MELVSGFAARLREYKEDKGLTFVELSARVGIPAPTLNRYMMEQRYPKMETVKDIATKLRVNPLWLMGYDVPIDEIDNIVVNLRPRFSTNSVPRLGAIACGEPVLADDNIEGYDEVPDYVRCDFTLQCEGDSMINARIHDGDIVCVKQQPTVDNGQIAAVLIDEDYATGATLKRVRFTKDGVILLPENPAYEPMVFTGDDVNRVRILGLATHFISKVH